MWTGLLGLALAIAASIKFGSIMFVVSFALWVGMTRLLMSWLLLLSGHPIGPAFPLLLYYNQIVGSIVKIHVSIRLDQQSWTRQRTTLAASGESFPTRFHVWSLQYLTLADLHVLSAGLLVE